MASSISSGTTLVSSQVSKINPIDRLRQILLNINKSQTKGIEILVSIAEEHQLITDQNFIPWDDKFLRGGYIDNISIECLNGKNFAWTIDPSDRIALILKIEGLYLSERKNFIKVLFMRMNTMNILADALIIKNDGIKESDAMSFSMSSLLPIYNQKELFSHFQSLIETKEVIIKADKMFIKKEKEPLASILFTLSVESL